MKYIIIGNDHPTHHGFKIGTIVTQSNRGGYSNGSFVQYVGDADVRRYGDLNPNIRVL